MADPITSYATLVENVGAYMVRSGDSEFMAQVPGFVLLAEAGFNRKLKSRFMQTTATLTTDADGYATLPSDYIRFRSFHTENGNLSINLDTISQGAIASLFPINTGGVAAYVSLSGNQIRIQTSAASDVVLNYDARFVGLSDVFPTNWILRLHPDLYLFSVLTQAAIWIKDYQEAATLGSQALSIASEVDDMYSLELYNSAGMTISESSTP